MLLPHVRVSFHPRCTHSAGSLSGRAAGSVLALEFDSIRVLFSISGYCNHPDALVCHTVVFHSANGTERNHDCLFFHFPLLRKKKNLTGSLMHSSKTTERRKPSTSCSSSQCIEHSLLPSEIFLRLTCFSYSLKDPMQCELSAHQRRHALPL